MKAKALIYSRVSTEKQNNQSQIQDLKDYSTYKKYEIVGIYEDIVSGKSKANERTGFNELLLYIEQNEVEHILIWELSRLGRNLLDVLTNINDLTAKKINVYSKKENLNTLNEDKTPNPNSTLMLNLMSSVAEYERSTIKERTTRGLHFALTERGAAHNPPYGYMGENKIMVIHPEESKIVKEIYKMFLDGYRVLNIVKYLNINNIPTKTKKKKWSDVIVRHLLKNPCYMGERNYNFGIVKTPAIITKSQWTKAQQIFKSNTNLNYGKIKVEHYLNDLMVCGECETKYIQYSRSDARTFFYKCMNNKLYGEGIVTERCKNKPVHIDWLNSMVYHSLILNSNYLINSKKYKDYNSKINDSTKKELTKTNKHILIAENEIKSLNNQLNRLTDFLINDTISEQEYKSRKDILNLNIEKETKTYNQLLILKEQLNTTIAKAKTLKHFVTKETFKEHIKTFIQQITISKAYVNYNDPNNLKSLTKEIHYHRILKIEVKTIFKTYTFFYIGGIKTIKAFQLLGNNLKPIQLIESIVLGKKIKKINYYETLKPIRF